MAVEMPKKAGLALLVEIFAHQVPGWRRRHFRYQVTGNKADQQADDDRGEVEKLIRPEKAAVGPDPADVGGIAELKWIAEYADLHGILMAPHGVIDGLFGLAAHIQVAATLPRNYIALEYPGAADWWHEIVEGLPDPIVVAGHVQVWDTPGLGVRFVEEEAKRHLSQEDADFFD